MKTKYWQTVKKQMELFAKDKKVLFIGQQCSSETFYNTLENIPQSKKMEMPVAEEMQLGLCLGLALEGFLPICIYQRMDFLPRAADQIINHLNLLPELSRGLFTPKIIIRTTIGTKTPLDVGLQHSQDLTNVFKSILKFPVLKLNTVKDVIGGYRLARDIKTSIMLIERQDLYQC